MNTVLTAISILVGTVAWLMGALALCWCPWFFAVSAIAFGIAAATATKTFTKCAAIAMIAVSVSFAINYAKYEEQDRLKYEQLERSRAGQEYQSESLEPATK
jgi:hypothetical protein